MTELEKYEAVNSCETLEELSEAILSLGDARGFIEGRAKLFSAERMASQCLRYKNLPKEMLTRKYGIRQQAMYILHHTK